MTVGRYVESMKQDNAFVVCGSIQSIALNLERFKPDDFGYIIVDEAHHASADTYQKVLSYFAPEFTLGLTATPERADDKNILDIFKNTAHKLDIQTAVEIGELVPVRCIRIHTNIDLTKVRFNSIQYNIRDLESKIYVPERNQLIVDTWLQYVRDRRTVIFCASVKHAQEIAGRFHEAGVAAEAAYGEIKASDRREMLARFEKGKIKVLCACDLLNEGWDCPATEVLFMARPTMSKVLYTQQLGRGMRLAPGKKSLMVFDFVDNASQYNMPYSMHRLFQRKDYKLGALVLGTKQQKTAEQELYDIRNYKEQRTALQVGTGDSSATIPFYESCGFCRHHLVKKTLLTTTTTSSVNAGCGWWIRCACKGNCKHAQWTLRTNRTAVTGMTDVALRQRSDRSMAGVRTNIDRQRCIV